MPNQLTSNAEALRLFFTEDVYLVNDGTKNGLNEADALSTNSPQPLVVVMPKNELVITTEPASVSILEEPEIAIVKTFDFKFLGKNEKKILILVNDAEHETSTEQGRELLRKLVLAIGLTAKDFALVNYAKYSTATYQDFNAFFACKLLLAFGVTTKQLALQDNPLHTLINVDGVRMVFTTNLRNLDSDQASKKILWTNLQQLKNE